MDPHLQTGNLFTRITSPPPVSEFSPGPRYVLSGKLGEGASGVVFAAEDTTLSRRIAVKLLDQRLASDPDSLADFIREARISSCLEHPNVVPIHDVDCTGDGQVFLAMRQIKGASLLDRITQAELDPVAAAHWGLSERVAVLLQVANALAYAHHAGIVHRDVKPANILVGDFGEVFLVDWGLAARLPGSGLLPGGDRVGTPAYMSPEAVRGEQQGPASDQWSLAATMYQLLSLRLPWDHHDDREFWQGKSLGLVRPIPAGSLPPPLVAIIMRGLAEEPAERYPSVQALADDLRAWQAGLPVTAYAEPLHVRFLRWHRRHWRVLWPSLATGLLAVVLLAVLLGNWMQQRAYWGRSLVAEPAADWERRWEVAQIADGPGSFMRDGDALVARGDLANWLFLRRRLTGEVAIEFDGMIPEGTTPGDLSVAWSADDPFAPAPPGGRRYWTFQTGAEDNIVAAIKGPESSSLAQTPMRLATGRSYRIRAEIDGRDLRLAIDGRVVLHHREEFMMPAGWVGLYAYYSGKRFSNVRVFTRGIPDLIEAMTLADWDIRDGLSQRGRATYMRIAEAHGADELGVQARYNAGLAAFQAGDRAAAEAAWRGLPDGPAAMRAKLWSLDGSQPAAYPPVIAEAARYDDHIVRQLRARRWLEGFSTIGDGPDADFDRWLDSIDTDLNGTLQVRIAAAMAMIRRGRAAEALRRYGDLPRPRACALIDLLRYDDVTLDWASAQDYASMLLTTGRFAEVLREVPHVHWAVRQASFRLDGAGFIADMAGRDELPKAEWLLCLDRPQEAMARSKSPIVAAAALLALGRVQEAAKAVEAASSDVRAAAWIAAGRGDELLADPLCGPEARLLAWADQAIGQLERGDAAGAVPSARRIAGETWRHGQAQAWFARSVLVPYIHSRHGRTEAFAEALRSLPNRWVDGQRPWHALTWLSGKLTDAEFLAQPCRNEAAAALDLLQGIRAELAGDTARARAGNQRFLARPALLRSLDEYRYNTIWDRFARRPLEQQTR